MISKEDYLNQIIPLIMKVNLDSRDILKLFEDWKENDGFKKGLELILLHQSKIKGEL